MYCSTQGFLEFHRCRFDGAVYGKILQSKVLQGEDSKFRESPQKGRSARPSVGFKLLLNLPVGDADWKKAKCNDDRLEDRQELSIRTDVPEAAEVA